MRLAEFRCGDGVHGKRSLGGCVGGKTLSVVAVLCGMGALQAAAQGKPIVGENTDFTNSLNNGDRVEWFRDQGFGLFIHWSVDSQLGVTISHSLVGASQDYTERFFNELPKTFDPVRFDPAEWARLALATWPSAKFERELKAHHWLFVNSPEKLDPLY